MARARAAPVVSAAPQALGHDMGEPTPAAGGKSSAGAGAGLPFDMTGGGGGGTTFDPFTAAATSSGNVLPGGFDPFSATSLQDPTGSVSAQTALTGGTQALPQTADVGAPGGAQTDATQTQTPAERISQAEQDLKPPAGGGAGEPSPELRQQGLQQLRQGMQSWHLGGQPQVPGPTGPHRPRRLPLRLPRKVPAIFPRTCVSKACSSSRPR